MANRHFNGSEKGLLALAGAMLFLGVIMLIIAPEMTVAHAGINWKLPFQPWVAHISKATSRIYGVILVLVGSGIAGFVCYRGGK